MVNASSTNSRHIPVMLMESLENLKIKNNGIYVDGTLGLGGHSDKILEKIDAIGLIQNYSVKKLDNKSAKIKIKFFGKINNLQNSLIDSGFEFKILNDEWILSLTG